MVTPAPRGWLCVCVSVYVCVPSGDLWSYMKSDNLERECNKLWERGVNTVPNIWKLHTFYSTNAASWHAVMILVVYFDLMGLTACVRLSLLIFHSKTAIHKAYHRSVKGPGCSKTMMLRHCKKIQTSTAFFWNKSGRKSCQITLHRSKHHTWCSWSRCCLIGRLTDQLTDWLVCWLTGWLQPPLPHHPPVCKRPFVNEA